MLIGYESYFFNCTFLSLQKHIQHQYDPKITGKKIAFCMHDRSFEEHSWNSVVAAVSVLELIPPITL